MRSASHTYLVHLPFDLLPQLALVAAGKRILQRRHRDVSLLRSHGVGGVGLRALQRLICKCAVGLRRAAVLPPPRWWCGRRKRVQGVRGSANGGASRKRLNPSRSLRNGHVTVWKTQVGGDEETASVVFLHKKMSAVGERGWPAGALPCRLQALP